MIEISNIRDGLVSEITGDEAVQTAFALICAADIGKGMHKDKESYLDAILFNEPAQIRKDMAEKSGCGMFMRKKLAQLGIKHSLLGSVNGFYSPAFNPYTYLDGGAIVQLQKLAAQRALWFDHDDPKINVKVDGYIPERGDIGMIGGSLADGGEAHVFCVLRANNTPDGSLHILSADAGQANKESEFHQHIAEVDRTFRRIGPHYWDNKSNRRLVWAIKPSRFVIDGPTFVPDNWDALFARYL